MSIPLKALKYKVGMPGMVATTTYKHTRQMMQDDKWVNKTTNIKFPYGTGAFLDPAKHEICLGDVANAKFIGIFQDPGLFIGKDSYEPKDPVIIMTLGDIWAKIDPAITVNFLDPVYCIKTAGDKLGWFTNVAGTNVLVDGAKFITDNASGIVTIALNGWQEPNPPATP